MLWGGGTLSERNITRLDSGIIIRGGKHTTSKERRDFFNWLFDHISEFRVKSKNALAYEAIDRYAEEFNIKMNKDWVYTMIRLGVIRDNDAIRFEQPQEHTFDEYCEQPSLIRKRA